jgi:hypothetical protein
MSDVGSLRYRRSDIGIANPQAVRRRRAMPVDRDHAHEPADPAAPCPAIAGNVEESPGRPASKQWTSRMKFPQSDTTEGRTPGERVFEVDYLVVGAGGMGMAFADSILTHTGRTLAIVDRYHQPGGHWVIAYPFVRLHQSSANYGVGSRRLGSGVVNRVGWSRGLPELASGAEVCAYFDQVMQQQFLPSGRVHYFPMAEHIGEGRIRSLVSGATFRVVARRVVDATYMNVEVPAMRPPPFEVDAGVTCVPPNGLTGLRGGFERFVVVGAGKTGMDACLFLLGHDVPPSSIDWVRPRDAWLNNRAFAVVRGISGMQAAFEQVDAIAGARSLDDGLLRLEGCGRFTRFEPDAMPTMFRSASASILELEQLRRIRNVVRLGHVHRVAPDRVTLDRGEFPVQPRTLFVDCTADGLNRRPPATIFDDPLITLQSVRNSQQVFSASFLGYLEAISDDDAEKNALAEPVPHPDTPLDFFLSTLTTYRNHARWEREPRLRAWLASSRLNGSRVFVQDVADPAQARLQHRLRARRDEATTRIAELLAMSGNAEGAQAASTRRGERGRQPADAGADAASAADGQ